ncbi:unnamed protein product [Arctia plantaginis]|uniref:Uncharacterized protein n=1 Tax=Arctia plantaginis TaxID=874455 RepID=A0A8S0ZVN1_ARCPL|nr:unnamed protein product [Arctia plantaginis]
MNSANARHGRHKMAAVKVAGVRWSLPPPPLRDVHVRSADSDDLNLECIITMYVKKGWQTYGTSSKNIETNVKPRMDRVLLL